MVMLVVMVVMVVMVVVVISCCKWGSGPILAVLQCQANLWVTLNVGHAGGAGGDVGVGDLLL